ncbi:hypothetical protein GCM10008090_24150 [Arenicella chitinivorans]|uniref:Cytochrome c domain-containing protein n=1 Tax=Arenicella chitinivorans TaxID=1329800 RepID=A0A918RWD3_9GAMM|nr:hypothetical protein [Arenicella chitinivorans]GHA13585.1 hypothetical protein GCM10008090_24150 [Arenicella chitinivorans]
MKIRMLILAILCSLLLACNAQTEQPQVTTESKPVKPVQPPVAQPVADTGTCTGTYPSYWQDPKFPEMYEGQLVSDQPPSGYQGPVFRLSDDFPRELVDESASQPWRAERFDALFDPATDPETKQQLGEEYSWLVMEYIQAGNINSGNVETDWDVCNNRVRAWYNIPFQTYNVLAGREFTHGLTREAPVSFSVNTAPEAAKGTMWAVGYFNPTAAYTLGTIWQADGTAKIPTQNVSFATGAVVGKPLFTTLSPAQMPMLSNLPAWKANISSPDFCGCKSTTGAAQCTMAEESQQCPRSLDEYGPVTLLQFDIAVKEPRARGTEWVFGTFVADGQRKADEPNPWNRISLLGLMWGNSTPPAGVLASAYPENPRQNGFEDMVINWDTVDMLNAYGGADKFAHPGHLGCNSRLDGPADKAYSSCMSCHGTASVADQNIKVPPIAPQFGGLTSECAMQTAEGKWIDASGVKANIKSVDGVDIGFSEIDSIYFASTPAAQPFNATVDTDQGPVNILPGQPDYAASDRTDWISLDYSLQTSISIVQWMQWQQHLADPKPANLDVHTAKLPRR